MFPVYKQGPNPRGMDMGFFAMIIWRRRHYTTVSRHHAFGQPPLHMTSTSRTYECLLNISQARFSESSLEALKRRHYQEFHFWCVWCIRLVSLGLFSQEVVATELTVRKASSPTVTPPGVSEPRIWRGIGEAIAPNWARWKLSLHTKSGGGRYCPLACGNNINQRPYRVEIQERGRRRPV